MCPCNKKATPQPLSSKLTGHIAPRRTQLLQPHAVSTPYLTPLATVDTSIWGPPLWKVLHTLSLVATDRQLWNDIAEALKTDLPCPECSQHYNTWVTSNPLRFPVSVPPRQPFIPRFLKTRTPYTAPPINHTVSLWVLALHNDVNMRNSRAIWGIDQVRNTYQDINSAKNELKELNGVIGPTLYTLLANA